MEKKHVTMKIKERLVRKAIGKQPESVANEYGDGDWPWCLGMFYQPKKPIMVKHDTDLSGK